MQQGLLASRLLSNALAGCSCAAPLAVSIAARRAAASAAGPDEGKPSSGIKLTPAQQQQLPQLLATLHRPTAAVHSLASLTHAAACFRDMSVLMSGLQLRNRGVSHPLALSEEEYAAAVKAPASAGSAGGAADGGAGAAAAGAEAGGSGAVGPGVRGTYMPLRDTTTVDDMQAVTGVRAPEDQTEVFDQKLMDKISCWQQTQPSHVEMSQALMTGVKLFPPQEVSYPTYVDFDAALRLLRHHQSRRKLRLSRKLLRKQDKYQLKVWQHHTGEV